MGFDDYKGRPLSSIVKTMAPGSPQSNYEEEGTSPVQRVGAGAGIANPAIAVVPLGEPDTPVAPTKQPNWASDVDEQSLTIAQAKTKLARTFGVDPSSIKITVEA